MQIFYSSYFKRVYRKLPEFLRRKAEKAEKIFRSDPFDPRLKTHKLQGQYKRYWAFSVSESHRIMFEFCSDETVGFINIGDHDIYK